MANPFSTDRRTKLGKENAETLLILKIIYWVISSCLKVCYYILIWPLLKIYILNWRLIKLIWKKRLLVSHICTLGIFIWIPKLFRKYKENTKNKISDEEH
jgi:hypothetical protein